MSDAQPPVAPAPTLSVDRFITWGLLGLGVYTVFSGLGAFINPRSQMNALYTELNKLEPALQLTTYNNVPFATAIGWVCVTVQAAILGLIIWWALRRMRANKPAWWIPVVGYLIANTLVSILLLVALCGDPAFLDGLARVGASMGTPHTRTPEPSPSAPLS